LVKLAAKLDSTQIKTMRNLHPVITSTVLCLLSVALCRAADSSTVQQAIAVLHPTAGQHCHGTVRFTQDGDAVKVVADIEGLTPGQKHAFHIHQYGDCSAPDGMSAGGHYNPEGHQHGLPEAQNRHAGDLGNIQADNDGKAHYEITVNNCSVMGAKNPIIGRGVIVHAKTDDGSQPVGNAGGRIACGVIGVASAPK
jgi:Cu-Zn family superoxide dismutase